jgi:hypothetical protein
VVRHSLHEPSLREDAWRVALAVWLFAFFAGMSASMTMPGEALALHPKAAVDR